MKSLAARSQSPGLGMKLGLLDRAPDSVTLEKKTRFLVLALDRLGMGAERLEDRLNDLESSSPGRWLAELQPLIERLNREVREVFEEICSCYDAEEWDGGRIGDLAFCALIELRARKEKFSRGVGSLSEPALAAEAAALLHNLKRALTAVQTALCESMGIEPTLSLDRELALALEVREAYAGFRHEIEELAAAHSPEDGDAGAALRSASASLARLTGRSNFRKLRPQDRHQLNVLQERILAWTNDAPGPSGSPLEGPREEARRLWQDLYNCTQLLHQVNRRQELVEHDRRVLDEIDEIVAMAPSPEAVRDRVFERASRLLGRDGLLDALLFGSPGADELLAALRSLRIGNVGPAVREEKM